MITRPVIVAGHICLDVTPDLSSIPEGAFKTLLQPGHMLQAGLVRLSPGGAVSNTGLALHRLGVPARLIGKIGADLFGQTLQDSIRQESPALTHDLVVDPSMPTSVTIVINPPGFDRSFLHSPGANATFYASDIPRQVLSEGSIFHFGYPSTMRSVFRDEGGELVSILQRARREGLTTSLDFSMPDPTSPAGQADWDIILANSLPYVDFFLPSAEELVFLLRRETYEQMHQNPETSFLDAVTPDLLDELGDIVLGHGVKTLMVKVGHRGVYLRTAPESAWKRTVRGQVRHAVPLLEDQGSSWYNRALWAPAFAVDVSDATGAGDAAIAGFLASILRGTDPETALVMAAASGAASVESGDLQHWDALFARRERGWPTLPLEIHQPGWRKDETHGLWFRS